MGETRVKPLLLNSWEPSGWCWGCGSAVLAAAFPNVGIGLLGVALAFGLTVLTMAYAIGHISGCHLNPAVTIGLWAGGRFPASNVLPYMVAQVLGGIVAGGGALCHCQRTGGFDVSAGFAPTAMASTPRAVTACWRCWVCEVVMTGFFLFVIMGATDSRAPAGFAPHRHRSVPDPHPPHQHPGDQHLGQPGAQHWRGAFVGDWAWASSGCSGLPHCRCHSGCIGLSCDRHERVMCC